MKTDIFSYVTIAIMMFSIACSNEDIPKAESETGRTISLTVNMPDDDAPIKTASMTNDNPITRAVLTQDGLNVKCRWKVGDAIKLLFVQGETSKLSTVNVSNISNDGKKAFFTIANPSGGIDFGKSFNLYGVHGGGTLYPLTKKVTLSQQPWNSGKLTNIETNNNVMLYFKHDFGESANLDVSVDFKHLGSLFCIHLKNTSTSSSNDLGSIGEVRLAGVGDGDTEWGYNGGTTAEVYDLVNERFEVNYELTNYIRIKTPSVGLANGASMEIWAWFPPLPDKIWPDLKLELGTWNLSPAIATSTNSLTGKSRALPAGKTFHFYAVWDGAELKFVSQNYYDSL